MAKKAAKAKEDERESGTEVFRKEFPEARSLWEARVPRIGHIEAFMLNGVIVIIQEYANSDGWNVFTPTSDDGRVDETLKAIRARCFKGCAKRNDGGPCSPFATNDSRCEFCGGKI